MLILRTNFLPKQSVSWSSELVGELRCVDAMVSPPGLSPLLHSCLVGMGMVLAAGCLYRISKDQDGTNVSLSFVEQNEKGCRF